MIVVRVENAKQKKLFIDFPHILYRDDPNYVPEIYIAVRDHLNPKINPYFKHSKAVYFLAFKDDKVVGRVAATVNNQYNLCHKCNVGFFGFFEVVNDFGVSNALLQHAENYLKEQKVNKILGPCNFTTNDTATLLVQGFDSPPVVQMTYNKKYYISLLDRARYIKEMEYYAYWIDTNAVSTKSLDLSARITSRLSKKGIKIRSLNKKDWKKEVNKIKGIYRSAWQKNWGFVPPTDEEFEYLANDLKMIVEEKYTFLAEHNGRPIGLIVAVPNINEILINMPKGRLLPFGIFKLLWGKRKCKSVRILLMGVVEGYRKIGIEAIFIANLIKKAKQEGLSGGEASWVIESNQDMVLSAEKLNGKAYKKYRIYSKIIS